MHLPDLGRALPLRLALSLSFAATAFTQGQTIDLSGWQVVQYDTSTNPGANWGLQPGNTSVLQSVNSDPSIFLSDFEAVGQEIRGTWRVDTTVDDDFMGFVLGYQGRGQFYLFDWKRADQGTGMTGMRLKVVQMPPGVDPDGEDLGNSSGTSSVTILRGNSIPWVAFVDYEFSLRWTPGSIQIDVSDSSGVVESWDVADSTYTSGLFGFYNNSQGDVLYQGFTQQGAPEIYCVAKVNSLGCTPVLAFSGFGSLSGTNPFNITASMLVNNKSGALVYTLNGRDSVPFGGGTLCLQPGYLFTGLQNTGGSSGGSNCSGQLSFNFNALIQNGAFVGNEQVNAQYFYRDPGHPDGTGFGLTEAIEFFVLP